MLKPDAFENNVDQEVLKVLKENGFNIEKSNIIDVDINVMQTLLLHYHEVIDKMGKDFNFVGKMFNSFYFGNFKVMPMIVSYEGSEDIIEKSRNLLGATNPQNAEKGTIRAQFSQDNYEKADLELRLVGNVVHASDSHESAKREIELWSKWLIKE